MEQSHRLGWREGENKWMKTDAANSGNIRMSNPLRAGIINRIQTWSSVHLQPVAWPREPLSPAMSVRQLLHCPPSAILLQGFQGNSHRVTQIKSTPSSLQSFWKFDSSLYSPSIHAAMSKYIRC